MFCCYKHMYKYVGPCTRAAEGSDLDQVLRRLQDSSSSGPLLGALFPDVPHLARPSRICRRRPWSFSFALKTILSSENKPLTVVRQLDTHCLYSRVAGSSITVILVLFFCFSAFWGGIFRLCWSLNVYPIFCYSFLFHFCFSSLFFVSYVPGTAPN